MAPEAPPVEDQVNDQNNSQQQVVTPPSGGNEDPPKAPVIDKDTVLPDDHPLIVKHGDLKGKLSKANSDLTEARAQAKRASQLETELADRPTKEAVETLQSRYDRLEEFLQGIGGPISKALDSRTFTRDLFESDKDVASLIKDFAKANPNATTTALGSAAAAPADSKPDMNALLRAAIKG